MPPEVSVSHDGRHSQHSGTCPKRARIRNANMPVPAKHPREKADIHGQNPRVCFGPDQSLSAVTFSRILCVKGHPMALQ